MLHTLNRLEKQGFEITLLDVGENGLVTPEQVKAATPEKTPLVTIMYVNNEIGTIQPIPEIGAVCKEAGIPSTPTQYKLSAICTLTSKTRTLICFPFRSQIPRTQRRRRLYCRRGIPLTNLIEGGAQERGKRAGTENVPAIMSMAAALKEACNHIDENATKLIPLRNRLIDGLKQIPHSILNGDRPTDLPATSTSALRESKGKPCYSF